MKTNKKKNKSLLGLGTSVDNVGHEIKPISLEKLGNTKENSENVNNFEPPNQGEKHNKTKIDDENSFNEDNTENKKSKIGNPKKTKLTKKRKKKGKLEKEEKDIDLPETKEENKEETKEEPKKVKKIVTITVNEIDNKRKYSPPKIETKKKALPKIKIFCVYRRNPYLLLFNETAKVIQLKLKFSKEINIDKASLEFRINEKIISNDEQLLKELIMAEQCNRIFVTKSLSVSVDALGLIYYKSYNNIVIIDNVKDIVELKNKTDEFLDSYHVEKDYCCRSLNENKYAFCFAYPNLAFDFNRFILILKATDNSFKDIKNYLKFDVKPRRQNTNNEFSYSAKKNNNNGLYVGLCGPYMTYEEMRLKEQYENRKKWVCSTDFKP